VLQNTVAGNKITFFSSAFFYNSYNSNFDLNHEKSSMATWKVVRCGSEHDTEHKFMNLSTRAFEQISYVQKKSLQSTCSLFYC